MMQNAFYDVLMATTASPNQNQRNNVNNEEVDEGFSLFSNSGFLDMVDSRMSAMMESSPSTLFTSIPGRASNSQQPDDKQQRNKILQSLLDAQVLRDSDVLLKTGKDVFLYRLLAGTASYRQRIMENRFLYLEYGSCYNSSEQQRIVKEIIESVWFNRGRFLILDSRINSIVTVEDEQLIKFIIADLTSPVNPFPASFCPGKKRFKKNKQDTKSYQRGQQGKNTSASVSHKPMKSNRGSKNTVFTPKKSDGTNGTSASINTPKKYHSKKRSHARGKPSYRNNKASKMEI